MANMNNNKGQARLLALTVIAIFGIAVFGVAVATAASSQNGYTFDELMAKLHSFIVNIVTGGATVKGGGGSACGDGIITSPETCDDGTNPTSIIAGGTAPWTCCYAPGDPNQCQLKGPTVVCAGSEACTATSCSKDQCTATGTKNVAYCTNINSLCPAPTSQDCSISCDPGYTCSITTPNSIQGTAGPCVLATCGNGIIECGEQCDGGPCCTASCTFASSQTQCATAGACQTYSCADSCTATGKQLLDSYCNGKSSACPTQSAPCSVTCDAGYTCSGINSNGIQSANLCVPATCGNGIVECGEQCDPFVPSGTGASCCDSQTCQFKSNTTVCAASTACAYNACSDTCTETGTQLSTAYCTGNSQDCPARQQVSCSNTCQSGTSCQAGGGNTAISTTDLCAPATEICNGIDDDCSGIIDDNLGSTTCGIGACRVTVQNCVNGQQQTCTPNPPPVNSEENLCSDHIDNDCNGKTDCLDPACINDTSCGAYCQDNDGDSYKVPKTAKCGDGVVQPQVGEVCDPPGSACISPNSISGPNPPTGVCSADCKMCLPGNPTSLGIKATIQCGPLDCNDNNPNINPNATEICNGIDDNCNKQIDESFPEQGQTCVVPGQQGICAEGAYVCGAAPNSISGGQAGLYCNQTTFPQTEVCNGLDDNCNGQVDEGFGTITCGIGACQVTVNSCVNGVPQVCVPSPPQLEICDNIDNDCDGSIDETFPQQGQTCNVPGQQGVCTTGQYICLGGGGGGNTALELSSAKPLICNQTVFPTKEACDNLDNNCNGQTDENLNKQCYGYDSGCTLNPQTGTYTCAGICKSGTQTCSSGQWSSCIGEVGPATEVCDNIDNNCNSAIDENDVEAPITNATGVPENWVNHDVTVTLTATDQPATGACGVSDIYYCTDQANTCTPTGITSLAPITKKTIVTVSAEGLNYLRFNSVDAKGATVCGDGVCGPGENNNNCPQDCSAVCGNGVLEAGEECDPPSSACIPPSTSTVASTTGICAASCKCAPAPPTSASVAGIASSSRNIETIKSVIVKIDKTAPVTTFGTACKFGQIDNYCKDRANAFVLNMTDTCPSSTSSIATCIASGVNSTYYCTSATGTCTPETLYTGEFVTEFFGLSHVCFASKDNAGNMEAPKCMKVFVDQDLDKDGFYDITQDKCPGIPGQYQGCPYADVTTVTMHIVDQTKSGKAPLDGCGNYTYGGQAIDCYEPGPGGKAKETCTVPLEGITVKVFNREDPLFKSTYGSRPMKWNYGTIFNSPIGYVSSCVTNSSGSCMAIEAYGGKFIVMAQFVDPVRNVTVYTARSKNFRACSHWDEEDDSDEDYHQGSAGVNCVQDCTLISKNLRFEKTIYKNGQVKYEAGNRLILYGSELTIDHPDYTVWDGTEELYPFTFASNDTWTIDVCMQAPAGYTIAGVMDIDGNMIADTNCVQTLIAGEEKVVLFRILETSSPEPDFTATFKATHNGETKDITVNIGGSKAETARTERQTIAPVVSRTEAQVPAEQAAAAQNLQPYVTPGTTTAAVTQTQQAAAGQQQVQAVNVNALMPAVLLMAVLIAIAIFALRRSMNKRRR